LTWPTCRGMTASRLTKGKEMKTEKKVGTLYLIPSSLGTDDAGTFWPPRNTEMVSTLSHFIVENIRTARRFLKSVGYAKPFEETIFHLLNKHTKPEEILNFLNPCLGGADAGLLSEAGCPCIADPGQVVVKMAHQKEIEVIPMVGPSSIMLALMSSGFNGQNFAFVGYLPIDKKERTKRLKHLEATTRQEGQTQIFMETPFRNNQMMEALVETLNPDTLLCVACDISMPSQMIRTKPISKWKKQMPDLNKRPSIFLLHGGH